MQVHGTEGSLFTGPLRWVDHFRFEVHRAKAEPRTLERAANAPLLDEMLAVRDAYLGNVSELLATGLDGLEGAAILEAIIKSLESGRRVLIPRP
jgi:predicted dehydrogenase